MRPAVLFAALGMPALVVGGGSDLQVASIPSSWACHDARSRWFASITMWLPMRFAIGSPISQLTWEAFGR